MDATFLRHKIGAWKLAGRFDGFYYAFIDNMLDTDIKPSRYPAVVIRRIKKAYYSRFMFERPQNAGTAGRPNNKYME